jgi:hypothetical protein
MTDSKNFRIRINSVEIRLYIICDRNLIIINITAEKTIRSV